MRKLLIAIVLGIATVSVSSSTLAGPATIDMYRSMAATNTAVTVTTGGTYQQALAQNLNRKNCTILNNNTSDAIYLFFGTTTAANAVGSNNASVVVTHGNSFNCATSGIGVETDAIQITGAATSDTALVIEQQ